MAMLNIFYQSRPNNKFLFSENRSFLVPALLSCLFSINLYGEKVYAAEYFPRSGHAWRTSTPESQGMSTPALQESRSRMKTSTGAPLTSVRGIVIRNGYDVWHYGDPYGSKTGWASSTRAIWSSSWGMFIKDGIISKGALEKPVNKLNSSTAKQFRSSIKLKHLLSYTSTATSPGSHWHYGANQFPMLKIMEELYGEYPDRYIADVFAPAIGADWNVTKYTDPARQFPNPFPILQANPAEAARWGYLWLNRGEWAGTQVVDSWFVDLTTTPFPSPSGGNAHDNEGWMIHLNANGMWGDKIPHDAYAALGAGGSTIFVCPSLKLVVAMQVTPHHYQKTAINGQIHRDIRNVIEPIIDTITGEAASTRESIVVPGALKVTSFTLVNADTDTEVLPLSDGMTIDLNEFGSSLNIRANTSPETVGSVRFSLDGDNDYRTEHFVPYALAGDDSRDYKIWTPFIGSHTITARPYAGANATGVAGMPLTITFDVINSAAYGGRIAVSEDGNQHDRDDIGAAPMTMAIIVAGGLQDRLVHYDYASHLGDNNPSQERDMEESVLGTASYFDLDQSLFFNDQSQLVDAISSIARAVDESTSEDPLYFIVAGPMEVAWRGINASDPSKRQYVTIISHSDWNDYHSDTEQLAHTVDDVIGLGVNYIRINDQNIQLRTPNVSPQDPDWSEWYWLRDSSDRRLNWLWDRMQVVGFADVSDSGMACFVATGLGNQSCTPKTLRNIVVGGLLSEEQDEDGR